VLVLLIAESASAFASLVSIVVAIYFARDLL
jgi:hypothetical protein